MSESFVVQSGSWTALDARRVADLNTEAVCLVPVAASVNQIL